MKRSQFIRRLIGTAIAVLPVSKAISQVEPSPPIKKRNPALIAKTSFARSGIKKTIPYAISICNITNEDMYDVDIFNTRKDIHPLRIESNGDYTINGVRIRSLNPHFSYYEMLQSIMYVPFIVGLTYLNSLNERQVKESISQMKYTTDGIIRKPIPPILSPSDITVACLEESYILDCCNWLTIDTLKSNTDITIRLYAESNLQIARSLSDNRRIISLR